MALNCLIEQSAECVSERNTHMRLACDLYQNMSEGYLSFLANYHHRAIVRFALDKPEYEDINLALQAIRRVNADGLSESIKTWVLKLNEICSDI